MSIQQEKILVRSVNWLGDAVMSTSALQRLREVRPSARITILSHEKLAGLWKNQPFVDDVMVFTSSESPLRIGKRLRWRQFDSAIVFPNSQRSALEVWFGNVPFRIGYSRAWRNLFLTKRIRPRNEEIRMRKRSTAEIKRLISAGANVQRFPSVSHHLHQYLHLVAKGFGGDPSPVRPRIFVSREQIGELQTHFHLHDLSGPVVGVNPGAEYGQAKRWPAEAYVAASVAAYKKLGCRFFIFGGTKDKDVCSYLFDQLSSAVPPELLVNLAGRTDLGQLSSALSLCTVVLTNDTGPMHLAAAVGTRVIVPIGSTSWDLTAPGLPEETLHSAISSNAPCSPCFLRECPIDFRCMRNIDVRRVVDSVVSACTG